MSTLLKCIFHTFTPFCLSICPTHSSDGREFEELPPVVPIMVGATSSEKEKEYGRFFAPYLRDKENLFIVSSDFCHWYDRM